MNIERLTGYLATLAERDELKDATWSVTLKDKNYKSLFGFNSDKLLVGASNAKLITTATALQVLGKDYQFATKIYCTGTIENGELKGNLIIKGFGDPTFGSRDFEDTTPAKTFDKLVNILNENGISKIEGKVVTDNSFIDNTFLHSLWSPEDFPYYYGALPNAINFLDNYFTIQQQAATLTTDSIEAVDAGLLLQECEIVEDETVEELQVSGSPGSGIKKVRLNPNLEPEKYKEQKVSLARPDRVFTESFIGYLAAKNIAVKNIEVVNKDEARNEIGYILSPRLIDILKNINFKSNNLFAECVYQVLVKALADRNETLNEYWLKTIGNNKFIINDGSGLSRSNLLTTGFTTELLMFMYLNKDKYGDFISTLPLLGKEGTVQDYCENVEAKNAVRFKTGSMTGVKAFAGIIQGDEPLSFAIIFNNYLCTNTEISILANGIFNEFAVA